MTTDDILREHGESLASINTNLELLRKDLNGRIPKLEKRADDTDKQVNFWRGALALLAFLFIVGASVGAWHIFSGERAPADSHARP